MEFSGSNGRGSNHGATQMSSLPSAGVPYWHSSTASVGPEPVTVPSVVPVYKLFDSVSVAIAAFLGTPLAGATLMAINYRRLGKAKSATWAMVTAAAVMALVAVFGRWIPAWAGTAFGISMVVANKGLADSLQGPAVQEHVRDGGELGSRWKAAGIGLLWLAVICASVFAAVFGQSSESKFAVGSKDLIYYSGTATKQDAATLGAGLQTLGYFRDQGANVLLSKGNDGTVLSFVVRDGFWDQPPMVAGFEEVARELAPSLGGFPIKVHLVNQTRVIEKDLTIGRAVFGKDDIYYLGTATVSDANALGRTLKTAGYFQDRGVSVLLSKGDGTWISFVVADGAWDDAGRVHDFEALAKQCAPAVGGPPIVLRLVNAKVELKRAIEMN